jgi:dihydroorotase
MGDRDFLIRGGTVVCPASGHEGPLDVAVAGGRIHNVGKALALEAGAEIVDASGLILTPGLIDLHVHVFAGHDLGIPAARVGLVHGSTTLVDAGSAGAHLYPAFRDGYLRQARERVFAFLNISSIGLTSILLAGELENLAYASVEECLRCIDSNRDSIVGVKARIAAETVGSNGTRPLELAVEAANAAELPLMVHIASPPPALESILALLRPRDIVTHCYTGLGNRLSDETGRVRAAARAAREHGVVFDVGHGGGSFDVETARALIEDGFLPDVISSDAHAYSIDLVKSLPAVMSKFLALGLPLAAVVERATTAAADFLGRHELGRLAPGAVADIAAFELREQPVRFRDVNGREFDGSRLLVSRWTMKDGQLFEAADRSAALDRKGMT